MIEIRKIPKNNKRHTKEFSFKAGNKNLQAEREFHKFLEFLSTKFKPFSVCAFDLTPHPHPHIHMQMKRCRNKLK